MAPLPLLTIHVLRDFAGSAVLEGKGKENTRKEGREQEKKKGRREKWEQKEGKAKGSKEWNRTKRRETMGWGKESKDLREKALLLFENLRYIRCLTLHTLKLGNNNNHFRVKQPARSC